MKISDFIFQFSSYNKKDGLCRVRIFNDSKNQVYALITDIGSLNTSSSVTNTIEIIIRELIEKGLVPSSAKFIEHYEKHSFHSATFDLVELKDKHTPIWSSLNIVSVMELLECEEKELLSPIKNNMRLITEVERKRYCLNPSIDFPISKSSDLITRIEEINSKKIHKSELEKLINNNAKEQEISSLLKQDLTFFAELYANPKEEYICFSEFPFDEGYVDYVVFTGRSRMDVYLIEIKGADFNFLNASGNNILNKQIENATRQIENRLGNYHRRYEEFRQKFHRIRHAVENGEQKYNSLQGPYTKLAVDPNKDVNIYTVIIGGRTGNDYKESRIRHDFEYNRNIHIKLETWDTWIRKLVRP